jgi:hypothetical protein
MKYFSLSFLLVTLLTSAMFSMGQTPANSNSDATTQTIMQLENSFNDAMVKADTAALEKLLPTDFHVNLDSILITKSQYLDWLKEKAPYSSIKDTEVNVRFHDSAIVVDGISARGLKGTDAVRQLRFTRVYAKSPTGWQLVAMHFARINLQ